VVWKRARSKNSTPVRKYISNITGLGKYEIDHTSFLGIENQECVTRLDTADKAILQNLRLNARISCKELEKSLRIEGLVISDRSIRHRMLRLEKKGIIKRYTVILDPQSLDFNEFRIAFIKTKTSENFGSQLSEMEKYLIDAPRCRFFTRVLGDVEYVCTFNFRDRNEAAAEFTRLRTEFRNIISSISVYDSEVMKAGHFRINL